MSLRKQTFQVPIVISDTTASTSTTTGALVVSGGLGVQGSLFAGSFTATSTQQSTLTLNGTTASTSASTGTLLNSGGYSSSCVIDATSATSGGAMTLSGGAGIGKQLFVGSSGTIGGNFYVNSMAQAGQTPVLGILPSTNNAESSVGFFSNAAAGYGAGGGTLWVAGSCLGTSDQSFALYCNSIGGTGGKALVASTAGIVSLRSSSGSLVSVRPNVEDLIDQQSFTGANNVSAATSVTGMAVTTTNTKAFKALVSVALVATSSAHALYELKAVYDPSTSTWSMGSSFVGADPGVQFTITPAGQVQYTSGNASGFTSLTIKFRIYTIHV